MPYPAHFHPRSASAFAQQEAAAGLLHAGRFREAERIARRLCARFPRHPFGGKALASALLGQGRWEEAIVVYEREQKIAAGEWEFQNNFANALKRVGRLEEAVRLYLCAAELAPERVEPPYNLGLACIDLGKLAEADRALLRALVLQPTHGLAHLNLANVYHVQHRLAEAERHHRAALPTLPDDPKLHNNLALCLRKQHRFVEAETHYRRALVLDPEYATAWSNYGDFLTAHGMMDAAVVCLRHAVALDPDHAQARSNLLFTLGHTAISPGELLAEHKAFAAHFEAPLKQHRQPHANDPSPDRVLRVGFVSADLRDHPLVRYLRPALAQLAADSSLELYAYNNNAQQDADTAIYRQQFQHWRDVQHLPDDALAEMIRRDGIDILIDLAGHSGFNRLLTFARKPAPVQISWMGYMGTTGLETMDYFLADEHLVPPAWEPQFTERILRVSATTIFAPYENSPSVSALPSSRAGTFTFACLARMNKLNRELIGLWSRVLHQAPVAQMMLATMTDGQPPRPVLAWFAEQGIDASRLLFVHPRCVEEMLALHQQIDLALDTLPYNGSTTSSHALWMGVPTLTVAGATPPGRMGAALNLHVGLPEFLAADAEEYVARAVKLACDPSPLGALRPQLRERFRQSLLFPSPQRGDVATALRGVWRDWCERQPR